MKIYCHNVRVWTRDRNKSSEWYWKARMLRISNLIALDEYDVLCLQELSFPANLRLPGGYRRVCPSISHPIYVRKGIKTRKHRFHFRWDECEVNVDGRWMLIINVHLHWDDEIFERCIQRIRKRVNKALVDGMSVIACGDWNADDYTMRLAFADFPALKIPLWDSYTFKNSNTGNTARIDHFILSDAGMFDHELCVGDEILSDHRPIRLIPKTE